MIALTLSAMSVLAACGTVTGNTSSAERAPASTPSPTNAPTAAAAPAPCRSGTCWVAVTVATAWVEPWYPRTIDGLALGNPALPDTWLSELTMTQKAWLVGKVETQAVYGTQVVVTDRRGSWSHVVVAGQPTNRDSRGYPGWIPTVQLTGTAPTTTQQYAVVRSPTAWVWSSWSASGVAGRKIMLASYDTTFPEVSATADYVEIRLIGGSTGTLRPADVVVHRAGSSWNPTRVQVLSEARRFLGLAYLWGGTSGFGFDCSGFTYSVFRAFGITLSRDADQQAVHGTPVSRTELQPGDLVFFRGSPGGPISHVGMYVGDGMMIDAPSTESAIRTEPVWWTSYAGARRYLSS